MNQGASRLRCEAELIDNSKGRALSSGMTEPWKDVGPGHDPQASFKTKLSLPSFASLAWLLRSAVGSVCIAAAIFVSTKSICAPGASTNAALYSRLL